jgi:hypothetical protein
MRSRLAPFVVAALTSVCGSSCPKVDAAAEVRAGRAIIETRVSGVAWMDRAWRAAKAVRERGVTPPLAAVAPVREPAPPPSKLSVAAAVAAPPLSVAPPEPLAAAPPTEPDAPPDAPDVDPLDATRADAPAPAPIVPPDRALAATAKETWIYEAPRWSSKRIGYLRAGAVVKRAESPSGRASCDHGWYAIEPRGYVCAGAYATLDPRDEVVDAAKRRPDRTTLPYTYVMSGSPPPTLYARVPSRAEEERVEPDLASHLRAAARRASEPGYVAPPAAEPMLASLAAGRSAPALSNGPRRSADALVIGRAEARSGFALLSTFEADDRMWGLTTELALLPIDRARVVKPSAFVGLALEGDDAALPVAFVMSHHAARFAETKYGGLAQVEPLAFRAAIPLSGKTRRAGGALFFEAKDGSFVRADQVRKVEPTHDFPAWARGDRKWIDVSIVDQTLVAYAGKRPVYVTLVSTGADGLGDPETTHSTILGVFRVHTKHVSVKMDDDAVGNVFDFRDVPFVQYFKDGYALHAAYWHDDFGTPRSHGCVNLAPRDAAWLFAFTGPEVPDAWHAALSRSGTLVRTRP